MKFFCFNTVKELTKAELKMYIESLVRCEVKLSSFKATVALQHINMFKAVEKTITMFNTSLDEYLVTARAAVKLSPEQVALLFADYVPDSDQRDALAESYRTGQCDHEVSLGVEELPMTAKKVLVRMKRDIDVKVQIRVQALAVQLRVKEKEAANAKIEAAAIAALADAKAARLTKMAASAKANSSAEGSFLSSGPDHLPPPCHKPQRCQWSNKHTQPPMGTMRRQKKTICSNVRTSSHTTRKCISEHMMHAYGARTR